MRHPFLNLDICVQRLLDEYEKHGSLVIAYDFDNTVYDFHSKGHDYTEVIEILREAKEIGCQMIVFTAERDSEKVINYLLKHRIPVDRVNENPPFFKSEARKIYFNLLLDDRAGLNSAYFQLKKVIEIIKKKKNHEHF